MICVSSPKDDRIMKNSGRLLAQETPSGADHVIVMPSRGRLNPVDACGHGATGNNFASWCLPAKWPVSR